MLHCFIKNFWWLQWNHQQKDGKNKVIDTSAYNPSKVLFHHHTYNDFINGKLSDAGGILYVSKNGNLQFINLFDLNADGFPKVVTNNDQWLRYTRYYGLLK